MFSKCQQFRIVPSGLPKLLQSDHYGHGIISLKLVRMTVLCRPTTWCKLLRTCCWRAEKATSLGSLHASN